MKVKKKKLFLAIVAFSIPVLMIAVFLLTQKDNGNPIFVQSAVASNPLPAVPLVTAVKRCDEFGAFKKSNGTWSGWLADTPRMMADANGDGIADIIGFDDAKLLFFKSESTKNFFPYSLVNMSWNINTNFCWKTLNKPRMTCDFDGDGIADVVGFSDAGVLVSFGPLFSDANTIKVTSSFGSSSSSGGWLDSNHLRYMADVNGDGKDDIVAFGTSNVYVAISTGTGVQPNKIWYTGYCSAGGWTVENHPRYLTDVNGDGKADIVGFSSTGVLVSLSTGSSFASSEQWIGGYGTNNGFDKDHPRMVADLNGDGKTDILAFGHSVTYYALSDGKKFLPTRTIPRFYYDSGWHPDIHPLITADINGDGTQDIVGFGADDTFVCFSDENGPNTNYFQVLSHDFAKNDGWDATYHLRMAADVDGDGCDEIVGFKDAVYVGDPTP